MRGLIRFAVLTFTLCSWGASAAEMNGIDLKDYADFFKNWQLVTVRYRKDTNEMRFVYANPLAWKALQEGAKTFPDGAVFGKVGVTTQPDPAFTSSVVPSGAVRYQLMVKNQARYSDTGGWGYGLYRKDGSLFPEDPKKTTIACHACHMIVPQRDFVFSQPAAFLDFAKPSPGTSSELQGGLPFEDVALARLPEKLRKLLPRGLSHARQLTGPLQKHLFDGTLNEVRPVLIEESLRSGKPALLVSDDHLGFAGVFKGSKACSSPEEHSLVVITSEAENPLIPSQRKVVRQAFCAK